MIRHLIVSVELALLAAACVVFVARYTGVHPVRRWRVMRPEGRHLLAFSAAVGALALWMLGNAFVPDWPGKQWVAHVLLGVLTVLAWQRVYLLIKAEREDN